MRISKTTHGAIKLLTFVARTNDGLVKIGPMAESLDIPEQNAFKIVHLLSRAGFLSAVRGRRGGVRLARPATEIRIGEVVMAIERMTLDGDGHTPEPRRIEGLFDDALDAFVAVLNQNTLADLLTSSKETKRSGRGTAKPGRSPKTRGRAPTKAVNLPRAVRTRAIPK